MVSATEFLITAVLGALAYIFWGRLKGKGKFNLPPGPIGWPLLGNALQLGKHPHIIFWKWAEKYGKVVQFKMATYPVILISDAKLVREAFNDPNLSGRIDLESFTLLSQGKHGVVSSDGPEWVEQRRFTIKNLRDFGFGRNTMESLIEVEVNEYMDFLKKNEGRPVSVQRQFSLAVLNSLWVILTGKRYGHEDPRLIDIFNQNSKISEDAAGSPAFFMPSLAKRFPNLSGWNDIIALLDKMRLFCVEEVEYHQKTYNEDSVPRDFIDSYLKEINATTNPDSSFYKQAGDKSLKAVMTDFLSAGSDTTSLTLTWAVLYLSKFPHVQKKLQEELDTVVGKNRAASLADRPNLPYVESTILEVLRFSSLVPFGVFHRAMADVKFHGYDIPKDSWICPNQYYLHFSEELWTKPRDFEPTRFLTEDGKSTRRPEAFMPFSYGKRACIGETLARDSLFLFITSIFSKFAIKFAPGSENVTVDPKPGFLLPPQEYKVIVTERTEA